MSHKPKVAKLDGLAKLPHLTVSVDFGTTLFAAIYMPLQILLLYQVTASTD